MLATILLLAIFLYMLSLVKESFPGLEVKRALLFYAIWIFGVCMVGKSEILNDFSSTPPRFLFLLAGIVLSSVLFSRSQVGKILSNVIPIWLLVGFQGFRVLAEWAIYAGFKEGIFPVQMTFEGLNFDIVTGVIAIALIPYFKINPNSRLVAWVFNIGGLILLFNIVLVAVLSSPVPFRYFLNEPANASVVFMPFILLPGVLVQAAFVGHLLLTKKLLGLKNDGYS